MPKYLVETKSTFVLRYVIEASSPDDICEKWDYTRGDLGDGEIYQQHRGEFISEIRLIQTDEQIAEAAEEYMKSFAHTRVVNWK